MPAAASAASASACTGQVPAGVRVRQSAVPPGRRTPETDMRGCPAVRPLNRVSDYFHSGELPVRRDTRIHRLGLRENLHFLRVNRPGIESCLPVTLGRRKVSLRQPRLSSRLGEPRQWWEKLTCSLVDESCVVVHSGLQEPLPVSETVFGQPSLSPSRSPSRNGLVRRDARPPRGIGPHFGRASQAHMDSC